MAAARLIVAGYGSKAIARHLGINHHTIGRWKRGGTFAAELGRLRVRADEMTVAYAAEVAARDRGRDRGNSAARPTARRLPPATSTPPAATAGGTRGAPFPEDMSDEDRECEALVEQLLREAHRRAPRGRHGQT